MGCYQASEQAVNVLYVQHNKQCILLSAVQRSSLCAQQHRDRLGGTKDLVLRRFELGVGPDFNVNKESGKENRTLRLSSTK